MLSSDHNYGVFLANLLAGSRQAGVVSKPVATIAGTAQLIVRDSERFKHFHQNFVKL